MARDDNLYLGIHGHVVCIRKSSGVEVWRTKLKGASYVNVVAEPGAIYAYTQGILWALDPGHGGVRWKNELPKLGFSHAIISLGNQAPVTVAATDAAAAAAAATGVHS